MHLTKYLRCKMLLQISRSRVVFITYLLSFSFGHKDTITFSSYTLVQSFAVITKEKES